MPGRPKQQVCMPLSALLPSQLLFLFPVPPPLHFLSWAWLTELALHVWPRGLMLQST